MSQNIKEVLLLTSTLITFAVGNLPPTPSQIFDVVSQSGEQFAGTWTSQADINRSGDVFMVLIPEKDEQQQKYIKYMKIQLLNPTYLERRNVYGEIIFDTFDENTKYFMIIIFLGSSWSGTQLLNVSLQNNFRIKQSYQCPVNYTCKVRFEEGSYDINNVRLDFAMSSSAPENCIADYSTVFSRDPFNYQLQVILYTIFVMFFSIIQFISILKICKKIIDGDENPEKYSLTTMCFITIYDGCLAASNFMYGLIRYQYFSYYVLSAFFLFLLSTSCDMKLVWLIWRYRIRDPMEMDLRRQLTKFFFQFCTLKLIYFFTDTALITYFILSFFLSFNIYFEYFNALFMIPQIIHLYRFGQRITFNPQYILGVLGINLFYPLYFRVCPDNFAGYEPSLNFGIILIAIYVIQVTILCIQSVFGPKSIVPKCLQPIPYNYHNKVFEENLDDETECAICLHNLSENPEGDDGLQIQQVNNQLLEKKIMGTPCGHRFHTTCLSSWMNIKLQCPACRADIPPLEE